jgi:hypothetical protein
VFELVKKLPMHSSRVCWATGLDDREMEKIQYLLAAQYERQRMFTSCGWFFDDFDRIEPRNNIAYAAQAVWLTQLAVGVDLSKTALKMVQEGKKLAFRLERGCCVHAPFTAND